MKQVLRNANEAVTRLRSAVISNDVARITKSLERSNDIDWNKIEDEKLKSEYAELVHTAAKAIKEHPERLHFKLEIIGTKASAEVWGNTTKLANGVCSAMEQMPELAKVILEAAVYFTNQPQEENTNPKTQE